jgi:hypothetical protein
MKYLLNLLLLVALLGIYSCSDDDGNTPKSNPVFSVKLVDAPSAYDAVNIEIVGMEINSGSGWISMPLETTGVYNLLDFTNGNSLPLLNDTVMEPFTLSELRLILGTNNTVVVDGQTYDLKTPSGQTSGYKVKMESQTLEAGGVYHLVLDFDVSKSVHETGNGKYMLKPVVSGYMENSVGGIAGVISPVSGAYYVEAANTTDTSGTIINSVNGQFLLSTVTPGTYSVKFFPNSGFQTKVVSGVVVVAGQTTQMGTITIE